jgi:hypothetical protein
MATSNEFYNVFSSVTDESAFAALRKHVRAAIVRTLTHLNALQGCHVVSVSQPCRIE